MLRVRTSAAPQLPGPAAGALWPARGLAMMRDPAEYFMAQYARHGSLSTWQPGRPRHVFAFGPQHVKAIYAEPEVFISDSFRAVRIPEGSAFHLLTNGLLRLNGDVHSTHRRLVQPTFSARRVAVYADTVAELAEQQVDRWRTDQTVAMDWELGRLVMLIAMRTILDLDSPDRVAEIQRLIARLLTVATAPTTLLVPYDLPGSSMRMALRTSEEIDAVLRDLIARRRSRGDRGADALSTMLSARDEDGAVLDEDELVSELFTAFCHDSSTATLLWTLFLLDRHPAVLDDVTDELTGALGGATPGFADMDRLPLLDRVVRESLRLLPPAPMLLRYTARPAQLGPYSLPEGATVFLSPYVTHRIGGTFADPQAFDPSRWEDDYHRSAYEYLPFGAGAHSCIGRHFANLELKIILAVVLQRFRPVLRPDTRVDRCMRVSMVPRGGLAMRLRPVGTRATPAPITGNIGQSVRLTDPGSAP